MGEKIFIGKISKGMEQYYLPFNIDNDAFPVLFNAYAWRGRIKRKRGTASLGRLQRQVQINASPNNWQLATVVLDGSGKTNLVSDYSLGTGAGIVLGSIHLTVNGTAYTDDSAGNLVGGTGGSINYATGDITFTGQAGQTMTGTAGATVVSFSYYPELPVMGLRDLTTPLQSRFPLLVAFDTVYAYQITSNSSNFYGVGYYKSSNNPVTWTGQDYQQFWSTNYQGAFWTTNNNPGMRIAWVHACANQASATITMTLYNQADNAALTTLQLNDYLFFNEGTAATAWTLNGQTGFISVIHGAGSYDVVFGKSQTVTGYNADTAIAQLLTSQATGTGDGIRWYDGDPTGGTGLPAGGNTTGWVNFAPPLTATSTSIDDETSALYYLVGALAIVAFKDRLLFFSPFIQTSAQAKAGTTPLLLNDTVIFSWNGTPYYTVSSTASNPNSPVLVPVNETANPSAYYTDQTGFGGWVSSGINQNIVSVNNNEDVLLVGFTGKETRLTYTSNDLLPFLFYIINSELGTESTFSAITFDRGKVSLGQYGFALTTQVNSQRIDLQIPNQIFQLNGNNNGTQRAAERISAVRDFYHEWIQFTFVPESSQWKFPTLTFQYNYREESWAVLYENFTAHGAYRKQTGYTWANNPWNTSNTPWVGINETWNSGTIVSFFPSVIGGTPQGFVVYKSEGTGEAPTGAIKALASSTGLTQITSINHCVAVGDYLYFLGCLGSTYLNMLIGQVNSIVDANNFVIDTPFQAGTYIGNGTFTRLIQPLIQTKQFPVYWNEGRKVRIGVQKYLMDYTDNGQVTVNIYLSQDPDDPWNTIPVLPNPQSENNSLVYSNTLFTCPESSNIGLTQFTQSINNPNPISGNQYQIWHRINTSLIGDTFQIGITLNDAQMRNLTQAISEISLHAMQFDVSKGPYLT